VAENYVELRAYQAQMAIARRNLQSQQHTLSLTESRFKQGIASALDAMRARAQVATTEAAIPLLETAAQHAIRRLGLLTGREPMTLWNMLMEPQELSLRPPEVPLGLPADLLRRRPDIRRAERRLAVATARIGVATADLYPKLSLTGVFDLQSATSGKVFDWPSRFWSIGPTLVWPIFDAGRIRSNIRVQDALTEQALLRYQSTVLASIGEVEDSLTAYRQEQHRRSAQADAVDSNRQAAELSNQLYAQGLIDFLSVLQAERDLYTTEDQLAQSVRAVSSDFIALYKAIGGGWEDMEQR
jgi:NodT family efflux transporter outer membrane factor (OMF) lipoprotein